MDSLHNLLYKPVSTELNRTHKDKQEDYDNISQSSELSYDFDISFLPDKKYRRVKKKISKNRSITKVITKRHSKHNTDKFSVKMLYCNAKNKLWRRKKDPDKKLCVTFDEHIDSESEKVELTPRESCVISKVEDNTLNCPIPTSDTDSEEQIGIPKKKKKRTPGMYRRSKGKLSQFFGRVWESHDTDDTDEDKQNLHEVPIELKKNDTFVKLNTDLLVEERQFDYVPVEEPSEPSVGTAVDTEYELYVVNMDSTNDTDTIRSERRRKKWSDNESGDLNMQQFRCKSLLLKDQSISYVVEERDQMKEEHKIIKKVPELQTMYLNHDTEENKTCLKSFENYCTNSRDDSYKSQICSELSTDEDEIDETHFTPEDEIKLLQSMDIIVKHANSEDSFIDNDFSIKNDSNPSDKCINLRSSRSGSEDNNFKRVLLKEAMKQRRILDANREMFYKDDSEHSDSVIINQEFVPKKNCDMLQQKRPPFFKKRKKYLGSKQGDPDASKLSYPSEEDWKHSSDGTVFMETPVLTEKLYQDPKRRTFSKPFNSLRFKHRNMLTNDTKISDDTDQKTVSDLAKKKTKQVTNKGNLKLKSSPSAISAELSGHKKKVSKRDSKCSLISTGSSDDKSNEKHKSMKRNFRLFHKSDRSDASGLSTASTDTDDPTTVRGYLASLFGRT